METVQVAYAKAHFSALLGRVEQGEELAIARHGKVIAKLVPEKPDTRTAAQALERVWAMGGLDLPDNLKGTSDLLPLDDINLD